MGWEARRGEGAGQGEEPQEGKARVGGGWEGVAGGARAAGYVAWRGEEQKVVWLRRSAQAERVMHARGGTRSRKGHPRG